MKNVLRIIPETAFAAAFTHSTQLNEL